MSGDSNPLRTLVLKESFWTFVSTFISRIGGLLFTIILARFLLPEGFGLYSLALSISILFVTFADLGLNQALLRYVSSSIEKNPRKAAAYFYYLRDIKIKVALASSLLLIVLAYPLSNLFFHKPALLPILVVLGFYTFVLAMQGFFDSLFYAKSRVNRIAFKEIAFQISRIALVLAIFAFIGKQNYVLGTSAGLLIAAILTFALTWIFYRKIFNFKPTNVKIDKSRVLSFVGFLTLASLSSVLFSYMDTIVMGLYLPLEYIGYYRAAITLVITVAGALSFPGVFLAVLTRIPQNKMQESFDKIIRVLLIMLIPATLGLVVLARYFLVFVYGYEYLQGAPVLYILSPLIFFFVTTSIFLSILASKEKTREFSFLTLSCTILNIILNIVLIKALMPISNLHATIGVAAATLLSWAIYFVGGVMLLRKHLEVNFNFKLIIKPLIATAVMTAALYYFQYLSPDMTLWKGGLEVIAGAIIYLASLIALREIGIVDARSLMRMLAANMRNRD